MIFLDDYTKKLVIPKWLSYPKAAKSRELEFPGGDPLPLNHLTVRRLEQETLDFDTSPTPHKASDLMGAALVIGNLPLAKKLAQYIKKTGGLQRPAMQLAERILGDEPGTAPAVGTHVKIASIKKFLSDYPQNPFAWIERARLHTVIGQVYRARECVRIATNLAPADRYVVRSAVRFLLHAGEPDTAWHYIRRASEARFDPWIKATEISVAELVQKSVKKLRTALPPSSPEQIFHHSELIESHGMLELINGNDHRAKKSFKLAWSSPSPNVVTHSEWIVRNRLPALTDVASVNFNDSLEAVAWQRYHSLDVPGALTASAEWALEEPYATKAFTLGSSLACRTRDYPLGARIAKDGLRVAPNDFLLRNNLCFALLKAGKLPEAIQEFARLPDATEPGQKIIRSATEGLLEFCKGNLVAGRSLYLQALHAADEIGDQRMKTNVSLFLALAEVENQVPGSHEQAEVVLKHSERMKEPEIVLVRRLLQEDISTEPKKELPFKQFHAVKILPKH